MHTQLLDGEKIIRAFDGSRPEAKSVGEWLTTPALVVGTWILTNKRLIFEGKRPSVWAVGLSALLTPTPEDTNINLSDVQTLEIVSWLKIEKALKATLTVGEVLIRFNWQTDEKLNTFKDEILKAKQALRQVTE